MRGFIGLTRRNLLIYFKDVQSVIFSMLTSIIVFVLYLLFLKNSFVHAIDSSIEGLENLIKASDVDMLVNGILLVGIIGSALVTVPFNCLTTIVKDKESRIDYDISATPIKRSQIIISYFCAATISAFIMAGVVLSIGLVAISAMGDASLTFSSVMAAYGIVLLGSISATSFFMILMLFFKSSSASGAFFGILSAASGFVIGAYIPISEFSNGVQTFCNAFPASHVTILFRNVLLGGIIDRMDASIGGVDGGSFAESMRNNFTFKAKLFDHSIDIPGMVTYICVAAVVCILIMIVTYNKTYKRK